MGFDLYEQDIHMDLVEEKLVLQVNEPDRGSKTFLGLTDVPSSFTGEGLKIVRVNAAETALEFVTAGSGTGDMTAAVYDPANIEEQLVGLTASQTITNKTFDADNNTFSNFTLGAEVTGASTDLTDTANIVYVDDTDASGYSFVVDEDDMVSDLATKVPTQQSVKAYVASQVQTTEQIQDIVGAMVSGNTETLITVTYQDADGTIDFVVDNDLANYDNTNTAFIAASGVTYENLNTNGDVGTGASQLAAGDDSRFLSSIQKTDLTDSGDSSLHYHSADRSRSNHTGTQTASTISDFDSSVAANSAVAANTAKVTNATHTGQVTGSGALTAQPEIISDQTLVTAVGADSVMILDATDGQLKKALISDFASAGGDMAASTYDPANISEQLVGLTATQTLTNKTLTQPTLTLKQGTGPTPTAEGDMQWDTDDNQIKVGDGSGTKTFSDDSYVLARGNHTGTQAMSTISDAGALATLDTVGTSEIDDDAVTYAKMQNVVADSVLLGNISGAGGVVAELSATQVRTLLNVEDGADVTDTANVTAAGALMDSEVTNLAQVKAFDSADYATAAQGSTADSAMQDLVDDLTPQLGGNLSWNGKAMILESQSVSGASTNDLVVWNGTNWVQSDADAASTADGMLGIYLGSSTVLTLGVHTTTGLTAGSKYYISTTAGGITTTAPSATGDIVRIIGYALSTTQLFFKPDNTFIELS